MAAKRLAQADEEEDVTQMAFRIGQQATGQAEEPPRAATKPAPKRPARAKRAASTTAGKFSIRGKA